MVTSAVARRIRERVMRETLIPAGFQVIGSMYLRQTGDALQLVTFAGSRAGGQVFIELGFHYAFLPPLMPPFSRPLAERHLLDYFLDLRLNPVRTAVKFEWSIREDAAATEQVLRAAAQAILETTNATLIAWQEPARMLELFSLATVRKVIPPRNLFDPNNGVGEELRTGRMRQFWAIAPEWNLRERSLCLGLAGIASHLNQPALAKDYIAIATESIFAAGQQGTTWNEMVLAFSGR